MEPFSLPFLIDDLRDFVAERDWGQFHDPKNLAMLLASEAGELLAEYRWVRSEQADAFSKEPEARQRIASEIADVAIALWLLCDRTGIDLQSAMRDKLQRNRQRYPVELSRGKSARPADSAIAQSASRSSSPALHGTVFEGSGYASTKNKE